MNEYHYALIRYVPDRERMEPINVGIVLQDGQRTDMRLSPHVAKRKEIDTTVFQQWRAFLQEEIRGEATAVFQPEKNTPQFLQNLQRLCEGAVMLSRPLVHVTSSAQDFDEELDELYMRLVAPPESTSETVAKRPTGRFRQLAEKRHFLQRGMKKNSRINVENSPGWTAYRQVLNGMHLAIDKIEVDRQLGATVSEIERIPYILESLPGFLGESGRTPTNYVLVADELKEPFTDQPTNEFKAMYDEMESMLEKVHKEGGEVVRSAAHSEKLIDEIDRMLPDSGTPDQD